MAEKTVEVTQEGAPPGLLNAFISGVRNYRTTAVGALGGASVYAAGVGFQIPHNQNEWVALAISVAFTLLGLLAKDAPQGSQPAPIVGVGPPAQAVTTTVVPKT